MDIVFPEAGKLSLQQRSHKTLFNGVYVLFSAQGQFTEGILNH